MNIFDRIYQQAKSNPKRIVLPEGTEPRVIEAAQQAVQRDLARIVLLGRRDAVLEKAKKGNLDIDKIEIRGEKISDIKRNFKKPTIYDWNNIRNYWGNKVLE